jgi:hypothetical protein
LFACDEWQTGQKWQRTGNSLRVRPSLAQSSIANLSGFYGGANRVELRSTTDNWEWRSVTVRGMGGLCLAAVFGTVYVTRCYDDENRPDLAASSSIMRWSPTPDGSIHFGAPSSATCLKVPNHSTANGTALTVGTCDASPNKDVFAFNNSGEIRYTRNGITKCLDIQGPTEAQWLAGAAAPNVGAIVQLWTCAAVLGQRWNIVGPLTHTSNGQCLDWGGDGSNSIPFGLGCNGLRYQDWDYHWKSDI